MPKRSTPFQAIVYMIRQHYAGPSVTVSESKMLWDPLLQIEREVDVVIEGEFDGEPITISIEVIEHKRKASVTWAEQMIIKHKSLPTNRLILVSSAGFSSSAMKRIANEGGWVDSMEPKLIQRDGFVVVNKMVINQLEIEPIGISFVFNRRSSALATPTMITLDAGTIYDKSGNVLGDQNDLGKEILRADSLVGEYVRRVSASCRPQDTRTFSFSVPFEPMQYYIREGARTYHIAAVEMRGELTFSRTELEFTAAQLGNKTYASGQGDVLGRPDGVWVRTHNPQTGAYAVSLRFSQPDATLSVPTLGPFDGVHAHIDGLKKVAARPDPV